MNLVHLKRTSPALAAVFVLLVAFCLCAPAFADQKELDEIRAAIHAKGAKWVAGQTSLSDLPWIEKKRRANLDLNRELAAILSQPAPSEGLAGTPDPSLDWRHYGTAALTYVSPVKDQRSCGSCWAFAVTGALESQVMLTNNAQAVDLSEQILVSCSGAGSCDGGSSASASNFIEATGLPLEGDMPYLATNVACSSAVPDWKTETYRIVGWHNANPTVDDIRRSVYQYGPVVATMLVYNDFFSYGGGVYSYATGPYVGAHAVLVVGYDDARQCFIVKNSWGTWWGEQGFFEIAYSEVGGTSSFGYSALVYEGSPGPSPSPVPEPTCAYTLSASGKTFKSTGGSGSVGVACGSGCSWSASRPVGADWIRITNGSGTSSGTVTYTVEANASRTTRTASLSIGGVGYIVTQQGLKSTPKSR